MSVIPENPLFLNPVLPKTSVQRFSEVMDSEIQRFLEVTDSEITQFRE